MLVIMVVILAMYKSISYYTYVNLFSLYDVEALYAYVYFTYLCMF